MICLIWSGLVMKQKGIKVIQMDIRMTIELTSFLWWNEFNKSKQSDLSPIEFIFIFNNYSTLVYDCNTLLMGFPAETHPIIITRFYQIQGNFLEKKKTGEKEILWWLLAKIDF